MGKQSSASLNNNGNASNSTNKAAASVSAIELTSLIRNDALGLRLARFFIEQLNQGDAVVPRKLLAPIMYHSFTWYPNKIGS